MLFIVAALSIIVLGGAFGAMILYPHGLINQQTSIVVSASGSAVAAPQLATLYVSMNGTGATTAIATSNLSQTLNVFNSTISPYIGGNTSRINTQSYSLWQSKNGIYVATQAVSVSLPNVLNISRILGSLSLVKDVYIQGVGTQFSPQQVNSLTQQALKLAIANATNQATTLSPNKTITIRNISVSRSFYYPYYPLALGASSSVSATPSPLFFSGRSSITETVTVVFTHN